MKKSSILLTAFLLFTVLLLANLWYITHKTPYSRADVVTVSTRHEKTVVPDMANLAFGVVATGPDVDAVKRQVDDSSSRVIEALAAQGIDKTKINIVTQSVQPIYRMENNVQTIAGYRVQNGVSFVTDDLDKIGLLVRTATQNGASQVQNIRFALKDDSSVRNELLQRALQDAYKRATQLAQMSGKIVGDVVSITENTRPSILPGYSTMEKNENAPTVINPGTLTIAVDLTIAYGLK